MDDDEASGELIDEAYGLQMEGRLDEAIDAYRKVAARFRDSEEEAARGRARRALYQRAHLEGVLTRPEARGTLHDTDESSDTPKAELDEAAMRARVAQARTLREEGQEFEAAEALADVIAPWPTGPTGGLLLSWLEALSVLEDIAAASDDNRQARVQICDLMLTRSDDAQTAEERALVAHAASVRSALLSGA